MSFWSELRRRNVVKVGVAYAIVAWLLIQGADIVSPHLRLPEWTVPLVIILLSIGFPLALLFAWAFEITPDGIKLTKEVPRAESITRLTGRKLNYILAGLLVLSIAFLLFDNYYLDRRAIETEKVPVVADVEEAPKTIAVLPFVDLSPEKDQEYFVDGLSEELLNTLCQIPDLQVTARTSSFTFKGSDKTVQEIASVLGVENILEGSVRKAGNALRVTAQLVRAKDGFHLWSKAYDRELEDIFAVQEDIATAVADELKVTLGIGESLEQLGRTDNEKAYELYLIAKGQYRDVEPERALESIVGAIAIDPKFALAWALKSQIHGGLRYYSSDDQLASLQELAVNAAQRAIELEPNLAEGYFALGITRTGNNEWIEAELAFRKALELITEPSLRYEVEFPFQYAFVGHLEREKEILEGQLLNDPLNANFRLNYIYCLGLLGDKRRAEEEYRRCKVLFPDQPDIGNYEISYVRLGAREAIYRDEILYFDLIFDAAKKYLDSPEEGLAELRRLYSFDNLNWSSLKSISLWAAYFGNPELAMDAIEKETFSRGAIYDTWFPVMHEVRQLPRFKEYVRELGLVDYWNKFGWPDICRPLENGDFECD